jgi:hypothetical protein
MSEDTRGYLPYLRALILLRIDDAAPEAILKRAGFTIEEVAELCDKSVAATTKAIQRSGRR